MITADHLAEAKAYVDELTNGADYIPGTLEWVEHVCAELGEIEPDSLMDFAYGVAQHPGPTAPARVWMQQAAITGALVTLYAQRTAEGDGAP